MSQQLDLSLPVYECRFYEDCQEAQTLREHSTLVIWSEQDGVRERWRAVVTEPEPLHFVVKATELVTP